MKTTFKKPFAVLTALLMLICMLPVGVFAEGDIPIDEAHFPDAIFRNYVSYDCDSNHNGFLSPEEIAAVTSIYCGGYKHIANLTGIGYFTALEYLYCDGNQLTSLDVSKNTALEYLSCFGNQLTQLNVNGATALTQLWCNENKLTQLDVSNNTALTFLNCGFNETGGYANQPPQLAISNNTVLTEFLCSNVWSGNQLTQLDVSNNTALTYLDCSDNQLTQLDVSNNTALTSFHCENNQLTSLDLGANTNLEHFYYRNNKYRVSSDPFDLTMLPEGFDVSKASNWQGGAVEGNILTFDADLAVYTYDCGNGLSAQFTLLAPESFTPNPPAGEIPIDKAHFPDVNFRRFVLTKYDTDGSGALSPDEIAAVTKIDVGAMEIADLTGIEYFIALTELDCGCNRLTQLDVSNNTALTELDCCLNRLTQLDVSNNTALTELNCGDWCGGNQLTSLDVSNNTALRTLECSHNQLTSLDLSANTALEYLDCSDNHYRVSLNPFNLTALPGNFDVTKASNWQGGSVSGNILTFDEGSETVTYTYDCGSGHLAEFILLPPIPIETPPGDYDGDGEVNVQDAIMILRSAMGLISGEAPAAADVDGNGTVNVQDAILALRMAMGLV